MMVLPFFLGLLLMTFSENDAATKTQVFVVPHSHMDVGWVYTVQESMHAYASNVYSTVVEELSADKSRRFIAVEQEFFRLWWENVASGWHKKQVKQLVLEGRLEFIIGGQVMHDEAVTDLDDAILQLTEGHGFLYETFGVRPQFAWHVDPFGASATTPILFALAGFDAHLISRIDYDLKDDMQKNQDGIYPNMSLSVTKETVKLYAQTMVDNIRQRSQWFRTPHVLWPWGCDKQFYNASVQFKNMDVLMDYINAHSDQYGVTVQYATLKEYFQTVHQANLSWDVRGSKDFLPYSSEPFQAWTGFYGSRNVLKGVARRASSRLHAAESLFARYQIRYPEGPVQKEWALSKLKALRWAVSEVQHHDGITGTESPKVAGMYMEHLSQAMMAAEELLAAIFFLPPNITPSNDIHLQAQTRQFLVKTGSENTLEQHVIVYNPLAWNISTYINISVKYSMAVVLDDRGKVVPAQIQRSMDSSSDYDLFFIIELGGLQYRQYIVQFPQSPCDSRSACGATSVARAVKFAKKNVSQWKITGRKLLPVLNECYKLMLDQETNLLHSITDRRVLFLKRIRIQQDFWEYVANGDVHSGPISDNYIFTANGSAVPAYKSVRMEIVPGKVLSEIRQYFYRLEQSYKVGPLKVNRESVFRTQTSLRNNRTLFTDDNGYQMMKRTYKTFVNNTIARNYYPMVRAAYIEDESSRVMFLSERAHGVSSLGQGEMEVMLHRRLWNNQEWSLGYNLTLNDSSVVNPVLWMVLGSPSALSSIFQQLAVELQHRPLVLPIDQPQAPRTLRGVLSVPSVQSVVFPRNLHMQTLSVPGWNYSPKNLNYSCSGGEGKSETDGILLRISHLYEEGDDPALSQPCTINLKEVLRGIGEVTEVQERSLTGTWDISELKRWRWRTNESIRAEQRHFFTAESLDFIVNIYPKEIRTFFVYFK
ncbi:hypothetical protein DNTS_030270 [Danionella cerebrum]|uniref:Alpha-mannosidase n=1 Tax=Danionella cerebrum TaxID=2873325 RepID=A0A553NW68_9TELE|nr:hypothetical protein DNTS_030270 [Danionella translucida]